MSQFSQRVRRLRAACVAAGLVAALPAMAASPAAHPQDSLLPVINAGDNLLMFDWPALRIGTGEYEEGPTGVTVFRFPRKVRAAVDVRGGGPATVNTDYLRLGYDEPILDALVFSGGSAYGLEATTAVASQLKDDGVNSGHWYDVAFVSGAIIFDLGDRRFNVITPDKRLAETASRAARPGVFPLGAHGAGTMAMTGAMFGCNAHSGEGGAFRQIGAIKLAVFTVVNPAGVVTDREGHVAACYRTPDMPAVLRTSDLMAGIGSRLAAETATDGPAAPASPRNTTISLVVTNVRLPPAELQRLAIQVHTSMGRAIQPFQTKFDGDVLFAVSTDEIDLPSLHRGAGTVDLGTVASEAMWDAVLAAVPPQQSVVQPVAGMKPVHPERAAGQWAFSRDVSLGVTLREGRLFARSTGHDPVGAIPASAEVELLPVSGCDYTVPGRYPIELNFCGPDLVFNPGRWQQVAHRQP